jgi:ABC-2 type transport system ATP-binding protein
MMADLEHASVSSYMSSITVPTLLLQGENDTLFNLNEAIENYDALRAQGTPVDMIWQSWGHSSLSPAPGEMDLGHPDPTTQYETLRVVLWFDRYLKGEPVPTGPGFSYFRDWVSYRGNASPAYASAPSYPVGTSVPFYLSADRQLVQTPGALSVGAQTFVTTSAGLPTGVSDPDAIGSALGQFPDLNLPGTDASWTSAPLASTLDVVGAPQVRVGILAPSAEATQLAGPGGQLVLFAKVYDVAPNGKAQLIHGLVAPARVADVRQPVTITLPAIVHRFGVGHRIELVLAAGDLNYRGGLISTPVVVSTGSTGQALTLPIVP